MSQPPMNNPMRADGFMAETLDGETVLFHPERNIMVYGNETAALIWQLCDGRHTVAEIVDILSAAYPEARDDIAADVPPTINALLQQGALEYG